MRIAEKKNLYYQGHVWQILHNLRSCDTKWQYYKWFCSTGSRWSPSWTADSSLPDTHLPKINILECLSWTIPIIILIVKLMTVGVIILNGVSFFFVAELVQDGKVQKLFEIRAEEKTCWYWNRTKKTDSTKDRYNPVITDDSCWFFFWPRTSPARTGYPILDLSSQILLFRFHFRHRLFPMAMTRCTIEFLWNIRGPCCAQSLSAINCWYLLANNTN